MILVAAAVAAVPEDVSVTQVVMSGIMLAMLAVATVLVGMISGRARRTEDAVHAPDGRSVSDQVTALTGRVAANEQRMTDHGERLGAVEASAAGVHRRVDIIADDIRQVRRDHGERLGAVEQEVAALKGAPCLTPHPGETHDH